MSFPGASLDGLVTNVQFFLNSTQIANFTNPPYGTSISYDFAGPSTLTARAYDNKGALRETNLTVNFFTLPLHVISTPGAIVNGGFKLCMLGQAGNDYDVLASTNLNTTNWIILAQWNRSMGRGDLRIQTPQVFPDDFIGRSNSDCAAMWETRRQDAQCH